MHRHVPSCLKGPILSARFRHSGGPAAGDPRPETRQELVERIRREIAAGTYETPEKWEAALDRLLERLREE